jgi:hypothetical protein
MVYLPTLPAITLYSVEWRDDLRIMLLSLFLTDACHAVEETMSITHDFHIAWGHLEMTAGSVCFQRVGRHKATDDPRSLPARTLRSNKAYLRLGRPIYT